MIVAATPSTISCIVFLDKDLAESDVPCVESVIGPPFPAISLKFLAIPVRPSTDSFKDFTSFECKSIRAFVGSFSNSTSTDDADIDADADADDTDVDADDSVADSVAATDSDDDGDDDDDNDADINDSNNGDDDDDDDDAVAVAVIDSFAVLLS